MLPSTALQFYNAAVKANEMWESQVPDKCVIPVAAIDSPRLFCQDQLFNLAEFAVFDSLDKGGGRTKGIRASLAFVGSKEWIGDLNR